MGPINLLRLRSGSKNNATKNENLAYIFRKTWRRKVCIVLNFDPSKTVFIEQYIDQNQEKIGNVIFSKTELEHDDGDDSKEPYKSPKNEA